MLAFWGGTGCGRAVSGDGEASAPVSKGTKALSAPFPFDTPEHYRVVSTVTLDADGPGGQDTYALINEAFGRGCMEVPDRYRGNHQEVRHVREGSDPEKGDHFVFLMHRDLDHDRDKGRDRQRNEIKGHAGSPAAMKGAKGKAYVYMWRFRFDEELKISKRFSHFFQIKSYGGEGYPLATISAAGDTLQIRFGGKVVASTGFDGVKGKWLQARCFVVYGDRGRLEFDILTMDGGKVLSSAQENVRTWQGGSFMRPKWGIYRSLADKGKLNPDEDTVCFAHFVIQELRARGTVSGGPTSSRGAHEEPPSGQAD